MVPRIRCRSVPQSAVARHSNDGIGRVLDLGVGDVFETDVTYATEHNSFRDNLLEAIRGSCPQRYPVSHPGIVVAPFGCHVGSADSCGVLGGSAS